MGAGLWIGILAVLAIATVLMFGMGRDDNVATFDRPDTSPSATTGSGNASPAPAVRDGDARIQPMAPAPK
jgi:hypothetical protein